MLSYRYGQRNTAYRGNLLSSDVPGDGHAALGRQRVPGLRPPLSPPRRVPLSALWHDREASGRAPSYEWHFLPPVRFQHDKLPLSGHGACFESLRSRPYRQQLHTVCRSYFSRIQTLQSMRSTMAGIKNAAQRINKKYESAIVGKLKKNWRAVNAEDLNAHREFIKKSAISAGLLRDRTGEKRAGGANNQPG